MAVGRKDNSPMSLAAREDTPMTKFDERTVANMEVALEEAFAGVLHGGDHESRKYVARKLIQSAGKGNLTLEGLRAVARDAFEQLSTRRPARPLKRRYGVSRLPGFETEYDLEPRRNRPISLVDRGSLRSR